MSKKYIRKKQSAFTLIEILVVVGIFAILSTIGIISITRSKNQAYLDNAVGNMGTAFSKVQNFTRAGRSVERTPPGVNTEVPRSYGISINMTATYQYGFKLFADFPVVVPNPNLIPHCLISSPPIGCDPDILGKDDTVVDDVTFMNGIEINGIHIKIGGIVTAVSRADVVFLIPTGETVLYYEDPDLSSPTFGTMIKLDELPENIFVSVSLVNPSTSTFRTVTINGGSIGGSIEY